MNIQLIEGEFEAKDALEIISQMIQVKIKYHENKINNLENEEDIKLRETKIKKLQKTLQECRENIADADKKIKLNAIINLN